MARTKAQIRDRAGNMLGVLPFGQALDSQDDTRISAAYDEVYAELKNEGLATWASTGSSPDELAQHLAALVAWNCADDYGLSPARYARIQGRASVAMREIRKLVTPPYESLADAADF